MGVRADSFRARDIYAGSAHGLTTTEAANQATATREAAVTPAAGGGTLGRANSNAPVQGNPAMILVCLILVFGGLRLFAARAHKEGEYESIAPSFYNIMVIGLAGVIFTTLTRFAVVKWLPSNSAARALFVQGA